EDIVTHVEVSCAQPHRYYRFDDSYTMWRAVPTILQDPDDPDPPLSPLKDGERFGGVLHEEFDFERGPALQLGETAGFGDEDLFVTYLDAPGGQGVVHSSETGKTFWLAAESPQGVLMPDPTRSVYLQSQYASLETAWAFRVVGQPSFNLELTHVRLLTVYAHD